MASPGLSPSVWLCGVFRTPRRRRCSTALTCLDLAMLLLSPVGQDLWRSLGQSPAQSRTVANARSARLWLYVTESRKTSKNGHPPPLWWPVPGLHPPSEDFLTVRSEQSSQSVVCCARKDSNCGLTFNLVVAVTTRSGPAELIFSHSFPPVTAF